jgi:hypothetical protein
VHEPSNGDRRSPRPGHAVLEQGGAAVIDGGEISLFHHQQLVGVGQANS